MLFPGALSLPFYSYLSPSHLGGLPVYGFLSSFTATSQDCWPCPDSFFFFFSPLPLFSLLFYPVIWRVFFFPLLFLEVCCLLPAFSRCSVRIVPHVIFLGGMWLWEMVCSPSYAFTILIPDLPAEVPRHSCDLYHGCGNTESLTHCATSEMHRPKFLCKHIITIQSRNC